MKRKKKREIEKKIILIVNWFLCMCNYLNLIYLLYKMICGVYKLILLILICFILLYFKGFYFRCIFF